MQKIIIKNFGAIEYAEIEIKKVLVLIGEQASGKSTIAKLIYFFKSLKYDFFNRITQDSNKNYFDIASDFIFPIREKFYDFFGSTFHLPNFEIIFYYDTQNNKKLTLTLNAKKKLNARFSQNLLEQNFKESVGNIKSLFQQKVNTDDTYEQLINDQAKKKYGQRLLSLLSDLFKSNEDNLLFVIAGRNATVSYSESFEKNFFSSIQNSLEENSKQKFQRKIQTIDETLMLAFMKRVTRIKDTFKKFNSFDGLIDMYSDNAQGKHFLKAIKTKIEMILKGKYIIDSYGEKIVLDEDSRKYIYLQNASSGQQESIRILQDIFLNLLDNLPALRIIEEPEAHLFPVAQKHLIELLTIMVNQNNDNQLIITTHSPYVLSVFNNLLFAKRVVEKNPSAKSEVSEIIPEDYWLNAAEFAAYSLGNQFLDEEANYCESIFDSNTGMIAQNYLDTVSEMLGGDFNELYQIHARTFKRK
ncbi:MAG: ATP-binding protein [Microcystis aeruginosa G13-07]|nr:ATP-binding protein [Microcystis aeruginosa G13-11]NCS07116.1 ATP-binding protein [Microcystis aeruginosa G13-07]